MRTRLVIVCGLLCLLFASTSLVAQESATLTGTITDQTGAIVAGAEVAATNAEHGIERTTISNGDGEWVLPALPPGTYDLTVTASGFKKYEAKRVILRVAQKARIDVSMQVGAADTEVTVEGTTVAQVETQSSDLSGVVTGKEITQLQLNGRNFAQLVTLVPGVSNQSGQDEGAVGVQGNVAYSINGGRTEYNNWELDGGDNLDNGSNTSMNVYPSLESIAEFRVLTSNYGAQYGRNGSGTVEVETKSGTNRFHGSAYEFLRNDAFNANNYFKPATRYRNIRSTTSGTRWVGRFTFRACTTRTGTRHFSSGRKNGGGSETGGDGSNHGADQRRTNRGLQRSLSGHQHRIPAWRFRGSRDIFPRLPGDSYCRRILQSHRNQRSVEPRSH